MTLTTLTPDWIPATAEQPEEEWHRHSRLGVECFAYTAKGTNRHPNEDGFTIGTSGPVVIGIVDEATQKRGVDSGTVLRLATRGIGQSDGPPVERLATAHHHIRHQLEVAGPESRAAASALALEVNDKGHFDWASIGDCSLILWQRQRWWRRVRIRRLNVLQHSDSGQLTQALGMTSPPRYLADRGQFGRGDLLILGSDGVFHENLDLKKVSRWIDANRRRADATLRELAMKILQEARLTQNHPDDQCLVMVARLQ